MRKTPLVRRVLALEHRRKNIPRKEFDRLLSAVYEFYADAFGAGSADGVRKLIESKTRIEKLLAKYETPVKKKAKP